VTEIQVLEYLDLHGRSPYADWFAELDASAAAKVAAAIYRLEVGNFSNVKGVKESSSGESISDPAIASTSVRTETRS
jgi:ABC-type cobalamin/Fe3+-siderophores transport system ATPase subunit